MTTLVPFTPTAATNFQFLATFDGATYSLVTTWNYYGQRYYITCSTTQGASVYTLPLIASPDDYDINLNNGYFDTTLVLRDSSQNFEIGS